VPHARRDIGIAFRILHTSAVQAPEFEGWKKLSVEAISFTNESRAFEPPT
jgi:hypothetical protein